MVGSFDNAMHWDGGTLSQTLTGEESFRRSKSQQSSAALMTHSCQKCHLMGKNHLCPG